MDNKAHNSTFSSQARSPFFVWMAGYCVLLVFAGFTPTYWTSVFRGSAVEFNAIVHVHGVVFFSWTLLFLLQSYLAAKGRISTHRSLGFLGVSLATAMVILGFIVSLNANFQRMEAGQLARAYDLGFSNTVALLGFATMVCLAIVARRKPASHQRYMLFAMCMILTPAVGRLYRPVFAPSPPAPWIVFITINVILLACIVFDIRTLKRIHPVTIGCGIVILAFQILRFPIPTMSWWHSTYDAIQFAFMGPVGG